MSFLAKFISKLLNIFLILLIAFLILNRYYVVEFSSTLRNVFIYLSLIIILLNSIIQLLKGSKFNKFIGTVLLLSAIIGGISVVINKQLNSFIYICIIFSLVNSILELIYPKS